MRGAFAIVVGTVFLVAAGAQDDAAITKEKALFKGTWKIENFENDQGNNEGLIDATLTFAGDNLELKKGDDTKKGTYTLNPAGNPKEIDVKTDTNELLQGIYQLKKDSLTMCMAKGPNQARPNAFAAKEGTVLIKLKRVVD